MKFSILVATSQLDSQYGRSLGTGTMEGLRSLAETMVECGIHGDIYDLPNGSRNPDTASPFSLNNGFALNTDELNLVRIPELRENPELLRHVKKLSELHDKKFKVNRTVSYTLKRTLTSWILEECAQVFNARKYEHRIQQFEEFRKISDYWLEEYVLYEVYKEQNTDLSDKEFRRKNSPTVRQFIQKHKERIEYYRYIQFLCFEQRQQVKTDLEKLGIGLIINLPFGVEFDSADVFFHPEVFDCKTQVGCSPEPEHGYAEQAWGIAAYKERTPGLKKYLEEKMRWISLMGNGIFLDHLVGWCGQYILPMTIPEDSIYPHGEFLTEDFEQRKENLCWFLRIVLNSGLQVKGEVAGDGQRVKVTKEVINEMLEKGKDISAMAIPRWEAVENRLKPLNSYQASTLTMVETHDTSTLLQYLLNRKGYNEDFETPQRIKEFCNRVLGLPFHACDVPLTIDACTEDFWFEICRRLLEGSPSEDLLFTLPSIISILSKQFRSATIENNVNVKPGTAGAVGNGWRNWSYFSPPVETMLTDLNLKTSLTKLGRRKYRPFDYFHKMVQSGEPASDLRVIYSKPEGKSIVFRNPVGKWTVLKDEINIAEQKTVLELVIYNDSEEKEAWERIKVAEVINLKENTTYNFQDLNNDQACYSYTSEALINDHLFIKLGPQQIHHFLVYLD
ncbi:4-alpha-glucanotransferase [bacterium]|nr:4-alpha-glucanotransferase [bacterium]